MLVNRLQNSKREEHAELTLNKVNELKARLENEDSNLIKLGIFRK